MNGDDGNGDGRNGEMVLIILKVAKMVLVMMTVLVIRDL